MEAAVKPILLIALCALLLAGCRKPGPNESPPHKVGPDLARIASRFLSTELTEAQRDDYWKRNKGRLIRARGAVLSNDGKIVLDCPVGSPPTPVRVTAYPGARDEPALPSLRIGEELTVHGVLTSKQVRSSTAGPRLEIELREAQINLKS
jgi:hypothetical protein